MVRGKTQMRRIENATSRQVTFSKRRNGLLKKAYELSVLCDAEVALIVFSPRGKVHEFASPSMQMVLDKYQKYSQESGISNRTKEKNTQHLKGEIAQMEERVNILESAQRKMLGEDLASCSMKELNQLESQAERGLNRIRAKNRVVVAASSQEGSASSDVDVEKVRNELEKQADESEEAWKQSLDAFKDQASRMQGISKEAYAVYAEKAKIVLKDTTEQLKVQSEKMRAVLTSTAEEIRVKGKENLSIWIENVPETVKDVAETAIGVHPDDLKNLSKIHDFCLGIPYGALLFVGGFLSFLITGSIPAVRFGVILGGIHLAASISSLKAWKKGDSSIPFVKGQAAIALIILLRESRVLCQRPSLIPGFFMSVFSAAILLFYSYIIFSERNQLKNVEPESSD